MAINTLSSKLKPDREESRNASRQSTVLLKLRKYMCAQYINAQKVNIELFMWQELLLKLTTRLFNSRFKLHEKFNLRHFVRT